MGVATACRGKPKFVADERPVQNRPDPPPGAEIIISKNLFDPERGAGATRETEANSRALQRIRGLVLIGTVILGNERMAIVQDSGPTAPGTPASSRSAVPVRMNLGDSIEGFKLAEIADKMAVFSNGANRVEVLLDYFRKADVPAPRAPVPSQPRRVEGGARPMPGALPGQVPTPGQGTPANPAPAPGQVAPTAPVAPRVIPNLPRRERVPIPQQRNESEG